MSDLDRPLTETEEELRRKFTQERGYWSPRWEQLLRLDPEFFAAYAEFSAVPWRNGVLEPKVRELIYIAIDASTTHLYEPGLRRHIRNALNHGATRQEILEVLQLISVLGIHSCSVGVPVLLEELDARDEAHPSDLPGSPTTTHLQASADVNDRL